MKNNISKWLYFGLAGLATAIVVWLAYDRYASSHKPHSGVSLTLEMDVVKVIEAAADRESVDEDFLAIVERTRSETDNYNLDVLSVFLKNFREKNKHLLEYFSAFPGTIDPTETMVEEKLRHDVSEALQQVPEVLKRRLQLSNFSISKIVRQGARWLRLDVDEADNLEEVRTLIAGQANLEFREVVGGRPLIQSLFLIDEVLRGTNVNGRTRPKTRNTTQKNSDSVVDPYKDLPQDEAARRFSADHPFTSLISVVIRGDVEPVVLGAIVPDRLPEDVQYRFYAERASILKIDSILSRPEVRRVLPSNVQMHFAARTISDVEEVTNHEKFVFELYGLTPVAELSEIVIKEAFPSLDETTSVPMIVVDMDDEGGNAWAEYTSANVGKQVAILVDSYVQTAPTIQDRIAGGRSQITGMSSVGEATRLAAILKAGFMKAPVYIIREQAFIATPDGNRSD